LFLNVAYWLVIGVGTVVIGNIITKVLWRLLE
jgi:hypothetical protein